MHDILTAVSLTKKYGSGIPVIEDFTRTFEAGTSTGLIGANGSGKTTLLRLLTTAAFPTSGSVHYGTLNIHEAPSKFLSRIGIAFDAHDLPQYVNGVELLEAVLRSRRMWDSHSSGTIDSMLERLGMDERRHNLIGTYSSGMMQKILIAASLITRPEILFLDEPFRALDEPTRESALELLKEYKENGGTVLISSHMQKNLDKFCDDYIRFPLNLSGQEKQ
ncbi:MAG: ATP-binding cassette domain-containing protein [Cyclonatronaceae bacterium]